MLKEPVADIEATGDPTSPSVVVTYVEHLRYVQISKNIYFLVWEQLSQCLEDAGELPSLIPYVDRIQLMVRPECHRA